MKEDSSDRIRLVCRTAWAPRRHSGYLTSLPFRDFLETVLESCSLGDVQPGFVEPDDVLSFKVSSPETEIADLEQTVRSQEQILRRLEQLMVPDVDGYAPTSSRVRRIASSTVSATGGEGALPRSK